MPLSLAISPSPRVLLPVVAFAVALAVTARPSQAQTVRLQPASTAGTRSPAATFPRVQPGPGVAPAVATRINAALKAEEDRTSAAVAECRRNYREGNHGAPPRDIWTRTVDVTMTGPRFFSTTATDSLDCGGPYPNDGLATPLVFDLATGRPVNWLALFPKGATATLGTGPQGTRTGLVKWPELDRRAEAAVDVPDCKGAFVSADAPSGGHEYGISLDGHKGALVASPADFDHAMMACANDVVLTGADLKRLGFAPELMAALKAASASRQH